MLQQLHIYDLEWHVNKQASQTGEMLSQVDKKKHQVILTDRSKHEKVWQEITCSDFIISDEYLLLTE